MKDPKPIITWEDFEKIDLRTATVNRAERHPKVDRLLILSCNLGDGEERIIVAGIGDHYTPEQIGGMQIVIVANLQPRKLMGVLSQGMLLAVKDPNGIVPGDNTKTQEVMAILQPSTLVSAGLKAT